MSYAGKRKTIYAGGSNLLACTANGDDGFVGSYADNAALIRQVLGSMYANGQRVLRLNIPFADRSSGHTTLDSQAGRLLGSDRLALQNLLTLVRYIGFLEVIIAVEPQGDNAAYITSPGDFVWTSDQNQRTWNYICDIINTALSCQMPFRFDLNNEGNRLKRAYLRWLWGAALNTFCQSFSNSQFNGFTISIDPQDLTDLSGCFRPYDEHNPPIYPHWWDVHLYDAAGVRLVQFLNELDALDESEAPISIGECYFNDTQAATEIVSALPDDMHTPGRLLYCLQWPILRGTPEGSTNQNVVPIARGNYTAAGL